MLRVSFSLNVVKSYWTDSVFATEKQHTRYAQVLLTEHSVSSEWLISSVSRWLGRCWCDTAIHKQHDAAVMSSLK